MKKTILSITTTLFTIILLVSCSKNNPVPPVAGFNYSGEGLAPSTVYFANTSTNAISYSWDFGDNATATEANPSHTYMQGGVYTVRLIATGKDGSNTITKTINIATPTSVKITALKITAIPGIDPSCSCGWDANSGPDVFFQLLDNSNNVLATSNTIANVQSSMTSLSWTFSTPFQVTNLSSTYKVHVYDQDSNDLPPSPDDYIGGYSFSFSSFASEGYPTTITMQLPSSQLIIELTVQWQ